MGVTKDSFLKAVSVDPGNFRVYIEIDAQAKPWPVDFALGVTGSFQVAGGVLDNNRGAFIVDFAADKKQEADDYVAKCKTHPSNWLVEGPTLVK